ncbi:MAG TPA: sigma-70 family RNA polymerase sigma factor [Ktedonobacteraceae bacterium]|nr:sigma-70 family RNA polymerase sigma factor [Ktedonobacteraceae bacterium]
MQQDLGTTLDNPSLALLYQRFAPVLFAYIYRHTSSREDAEDLLLEVFLAALEYSGFARLAAKEQENWLWSVARNKVIDHYRRNSRYAGVQLDLVLDDLYERDEDAPEYVMLRREEYAHLRANIEQLPALQQELLRLRFANDLRCAEIAIVLQKSEGAVRMLLSRTMKFLRAIYEKEARGRDDARYE